MIPCKLAAHMSDRDLYRWYRGAVPRMRKRPYPMLLDRDGEATRLFPSEAGAATILTLDSLRIVAIDYADSAAEIRQSLGVAAETDNAED